MNSLQTQILISGKSLHVSSKSNIYRSLGQLKDFMILDTGTSTDAIAV